MSRQVLLVALVIFALLAVLGVYQALQPPDWSGSPIEPPYAMPGFTLQGGKGPVSLDQFAGRYVILYFGYTGCPDVCPTTLAALREALSRLGADANQFQVIFISVDPARDTPEAASAYAARFAPDFLGLSGSAEQVAAVVKGFGIFAQTNPPDPQTGFYTVDHTATTMVLNRQGELTLTWPYGLQPNQLEADMRILLKR
jgi:protein SCO1/2